MAICTTMLVGGSRDPMMRRTESLPMVSLSAEFNKTETDMCGPKSAGGNIVTHLHLRARAWHPIATRGSIYLGIFDSVTLIPAPCVAQLEHATVMSLGCVFFVHLQNLWWSA